MSVMQLGEKQLARMVVVATMVSSGFATSVIRGETLQPFNCCTVTGRTSLSNSYAAAVLFELPKPGVPYRVDRIEIGSEGNGATFPSGTSIKLHILDAQTDTLFASDDLELGGLDASLAFRSFDINSISGGSVEVMDSFYGGVQSTGTPFEFGIAFDSPIGNNFGKSFSYNVGTGSLSSESQDLMIQAIVTELAPPVPGDGNFDGHIDGVDYLIWAEHFGDDPADNPPGAPANGDFNGDSVVDGLDYILWASNFGQGPNDITAVPEPDGFILAMLAIIGIFARRRR